MILLSLLVIPGTIIPLGLYFWRLNRVITAVPPEALVLSPHRWTVDSIRDQALQLSKSRFDVVQHLPPPTGRRYVVIGGSGLVGGWIVFDLLRRGESPKNIRIVDIRRPVRKDMLNGKAAEVSFVQADVKDLDSIRHALAAEWPSNIESANQGTTVFHTVAGIRYYERHRILIPRSSVLNVEGTRNALAAAREAGVDIFIFTSSASISITRTNFWVWPWNKYPKTLVQVVDDQTLASSVERKHEEFFSNYAYTKYLSENLVKEADDPDNGFRTGCLRPGNAIFGPGGDLNAGAYLVRGVNPSWVGPMVQSFTYVKNVSYGHLLYEQRLIEALSSPPAAPVHKLGGQSFLIADTGDPPTYHDVYLALNTLTDGRTQFPALPPAPLFIIAHLVEFYYVLQARFPRVLPAITGDLANLQPSIFDLVTIHLKINDYRARLLPSDGGLGYQPPWTTLDGVCELVNEFLKDTSEGDEHQKAAGGIGLGFRTNANINRRQM